MANNKAQSSTEHRRTISDSLVPVIEYLELKGDRVVLFDDIRNQLRGRSNSTIRWMVHELIQRGWLEPLVLKGAYEFIPGAAAGKYRSGDPWLDLKAALRTHPKLQLQVGFSSAAWIRGFLQRAPSNHTIVAARAPKPPRSLSDVYKVVMTSKDKIFGSEIETGIPVSKVERIFVEVAWRPDVIDIGSGTGWLETVTRNLNPETVIQYLKTLGMKSAWARAGYLAELFDSSRLYREIEENMTNFKGPFYWGGASISGEYVARWKLYDNVGLGEVLSETNHDF